MKVLYALDSLNRGGAETHVLDVCKNAKRFGIDLTLVSFGGGTFEKDFQDGGFEFLRCDRSSAVDLSLVRKLKRFFSEKEIQIAHGFQPLEMIHLYLAAIGTNVKCVQTHQGFLEGNKNRIAARIISPLMDANISVSESLLPWLKTELRVDTSSYHVVYNTVDEVRLNETTGKVSDEFGNPAILGGMVANFMPSPTKDQLTVCRALPKVFEAIEDFAFVFAGRVSDGAEAYYQKCVDYFNEKEIGDRVFFAGARNDVPDILRSLDLFVFSSRLEGLPVAAIEAMLLKVPLLVSDIKPLLEVTDNGACAEVFPTGNAQKLADQMITLIKDKNRRDTISDAGMSFARSNFGIEAHFEKLQDVYGNLIG